jgi:hypothetical protein
MATDPYGFGTDISCVPDLDPSFTEINGAQVVAEEVVRRWQSLRGECADDPDAGEDVRVWVNRPWNRKHGFDLKVALEREAEKDERVLSCVVGLEYDSREKSISINGNFETNSGPFRLVTSIDTVTSKFLGIEVTT